MDALYRHGAATAAELRAAIPDPPTNAAVRAKLRVLEEKGYLRHEQDGPRYVYRPVLQEEQARETVLGHLLGTFFDGSVEEAVAALLRLRETDLSGDELDRLSSIIERHRAESE